MSKRHLRRRALTVHPKTLKSLDEFKKAFEGVGIFAEDTEKDIKELRGAISILNAVANILNEKGIVTHEEIKKELQSKIDIATTESSGPSTGGADDQDNSGQPT